MIAWNQGKISTYLIIIFILGFFSGLSTCQQNSNECAGWSNLDLDDFDLKTSSTVIIEENFQDMASGASFETGRTGWTCYSGSYGTATAQLLSGSMMGRVYASGTTTYYMTYAFNTACRFAPGVKIDFDISTDAINRLRTLYIGSDSVLTDYWSISFSSVGTIVAQHDNSAEVTLQTYAANTRYHISVEFVDNMHSLDVSINNTKYTNNGTHFSTRFGTATVMSALRIHTRNSGAGWIAADNIIITHSDEPVITHPPDITYTAGQIGYVISWTITDVNASTRTYEVYSNGSSIDNGSWNSGIPVTCNVTGLPVGLYNYTIVASDGYGFSTQDTVIVNVLANLGPTITHPNDITYTGGASGNYINWMITDAATTTRAYTVYRNGTFLTSGSWNSGVTVSVNVNNLPVGSYNYTINASDGLGLSVQDEVTVTVMNGIPTISHPIDFTYTAGYYLNYYIFWTVYDASTINRTCTILINGSSIINSTWTSGVQLLQNAGNLTVGTYNYTIIAFDGYGASVQDTVIVRVLNSNPIIQYNSPSTTFSWSQKETYVSWIITDTSTNMQSYTIYVDGRAIATGTWYSGVPVKVKLDSIAPGEYNFTIIVQDGYGATNRNVVWITKLDQSTSTNTQIQEPTPGVLQIIFSVIGASLVFMMVMGLCVNSKKTMGKPVRDVKSNQMTGP